MAKKRKMARASASKARKSAAPARMGAAPGLSALDRKLDLLLQNQRKILAGQERLAKEERRIEKEEERIEIAAEQEAAGERRLERAEEHELREIAELKRLEERIQTEVQAHPLRKITFRDFTKGIIGAFIGIVAHFSFLEGLHVAESFDMFRATLMYLTSFIIGVAFLYFAGFRRVGDRLVLKFIPLRIFVIYITSILVVVTVLWLFGAITAATHFEEAYKTVSAISILAILGACTADLIGKEH
jgi:uncharacterized membrane protein